jgi:hypothetical protein
MDQPFKPQINFRTVLFKSFYDEGFRPAQWKPGNFEQTMDHRDIPLKMVSFINLSVSR